MKTLSVKIKVIIWDCDGTIRRAPWEGIQAGYEAIIIAKGKDPKQFFTDSETFRTWFNMDWHKNIENIDGVPYVEDSEMDALFHTHYDPCTKLFPWVEDLLTHLSAKYKFAILSSSSIKSLEKGLGDIAGFFDVIVGAEMVTNLKPHPEGVRYILNHFGILPEEALIIGDTVHDFHAGKAAGIKTGVVSWGLGDWDELQSLWTDFRFQDPLELFYLLRI